MNCAASEDSDQSGPRPNQSRITDMDSIGSKGLYYTDNGLLDQTRQTLRLT